MNDQSDTGILRLALVGYGHMGREIERLAPHHQAQVTARYTAHAPLTPDATETFDVAIEFTHPNAVIGNIETLVNAGIPVVVGTTGWLDSLEDVRQLLANHDGRLLYGSNFSVGIQIFFRIAREAARLFNQQINYDAAIHEIHHVGKADSPSGTALSLADILVNELRRKSRILSETSHGRIDPSDLHLSSQRLGTTVGTHIATFDSDADTVELIHRAKNRDGFAHGALLASQWLVQQPPGLYQFEDII